MLFGEKNHFGSTHKVYNLYKGEDVSLDIFNVQVYFSMETLPNC